MASFRYQNVYINDYYSVVGPYEANGQLKYYDNAIKDFYNEAKTFEKAEILLQKEALTNIINRNKLKFDVIDLVVGGDLINQISVTSYNMRDFSIPFLGIYSACATFVESVIILSNFIESQQINSGIAITSSHNLTSEKQFRFPIEYGAPKPERTTFTATAGISSLISNKKSNIKIISSTIGKVIDMQIKDPFNLGAAMAPACASVLNEHLKDLNKKVSDYDLILSGDLGLGGSKIMKVLMKEEYGIKLSNYFDSGNLLYTKEQETYDGASGPTVLPLVLFNKIFREKKHKKILILGTGALHSPVMVNQHDSIPGISYALALEVK